MTGRCGAAAALRRLLIASLLGGFASSLPLALTGQALQAASA